MDFLNFGLSKKKMMMKNNFLLIPHHIDRFSMACFLKKNCLFTIVKGTQVPSMQVNSGQVTLMFLPPGGTGETVLSESKKDFIFFFQFS